MLSRSAYSRKRGTIFGNQPRVRSGGLQGCCAYQTTDPEEANYIAPCCVEQWLQERPPVSINGRLLGAPRIFGKTYPRPR